MWNNSVSAELAFTLRSMANKTKWPVYFAHAARFMKVEKPAVFCCHGHQRLKYLHCWFCIYIPHITH